MSRIFDFFFGENVHDTQRYRLRHHRDGLCHDCKSKATHAGRCFRHHELNKQNCRKHYQDKKEKGEAVG